MSLSMRELLVAGVHFGHRTRYWHPKMEPYIFGARNGVHIINLECTLPLLGQAMNFVDSVINKKGKILFVGTKYSASEVICEQARRCEMPYVDHRWPGGMLTNYKTIRHSTRRLKELDANFDKGAFKHLSKKEVLMLTRKHEKLERNLGGVKNMVGLPDAIFVVDVGFEKIAVTEAKKLRIPVIGVIDSNNDPSGINYPIPGNDDSIAAVRLYAKTVADVILQAKANRQAEDAHIKSQAGKNQNKKDKNKPVKLSGKD